MGSLPPEVGLHVISMLDLTSILSCRAVNHYWNVLASDSLIWREMYFCEGWNVDERKAAAMMTLASEEQVARRRLLSTLSAASSSPGGIRWPLLPPITIDWYEIYKSRHALERRWQKEEPQVNRLSGHQDR